MAVEISPLVADRLPAPDWATPAASARFSLAAADVIGALEATALPPGLLDGLGRLAAAGEPVALLLPPDRSVLLLLLDGRRVPLAGAARDALLGLLGRLQAGATPGALGRVPATDGGALPDADPTTAVRAALVGAQIQQSRARGLGPDAAAGAGEGGASGARDDGADGATAADPDTGPLAAHIGTPLLSAARPGAAADLLADAVRGSGLFLEAHVAQWLRGDRTLEALIEEAAHLAPGPAGALPSGEGGAGAPRGALQLDALQRQAVRLEGAAWAGQPLRIDIERERERHREAANAGDATGLFVATVTLDLPRLGALQARIRVMHQTVGVHIESPAAAALAPRLASLASALAAKGLQVARIDAGPPAARGT